MTKAVEKLCGPWEGSLNRLVPAQETFGPACREHDKHYTHGGLSREDADSLFLRMMLELAEKPWHYPIAWTYYAAVRLGGWAYYRKPATVRQVGSLAYQVRVR